MARQRANSLPATEDMPPSVCPGTEPSTLRRIEHWIPLLLLLTPFIALLIVYFGLLISLVILAVPVFSIGALLYYSAYMFLEALGLFRHPYELQPLQRGMGSIRLLEILPGSPNDVMRCEIVLRAWDDSLYEALSYTWNCESSLRSVSTCFVGDRYLNLSSTLHRALHYLRDPHQVRRMWIDAICINQENKKEKSEQVQQMREIYAHAQQVVVWLDLDSWGSLDTDRLEEAFAVIADVGMVRSGAAETAWRIRLTTVWDNISLLLSMEWWDRFWIIQEVASNANVIVQCRSHTIGWDKLCTFLNHPITQKFVTVDEGRVRFAQRIQALRRKDTIDPDYGILSLRHDFRFSMATQNRDKIYALRGLISSPAHQYRNPVDYESTEDVVWMAFAKECLQKYRSLSVLAMAECSTTDMWSVERVSWIPDVTLPGSQSKPREVRQPLWYGTDKATSTAYSASGKALARCRTDLADSDIISVQGFVWDRIDCMISESLDCRWPEEKQLELMRKWKMSASRYSADFWDELKESLDSISDEAAATQNAAFHRRRLMVTERNHAVGLVRAECRTGDLVCILLGSDVPYILRKSIHDGPAYRHSWNCFAFGCPRVRHKNCCIPELFTNVGQAYVEGIMRYPGNIEEDIESGVITLREFFME